MNKKLDKNEGITPESFAFLVGGKVAKGDETGAERLAKRKIPIFKNDDERRMFYMDYIPALYWIEVEGRDPDSLSQGELDLFWHVFVSGIKALGLDKKEGDDMDG